MRGDEMGRKGIVGNEMARKRNMLFVIESSAEERVISQRHITDFFDQNLRRLAFNRSVSFLYIECTPQIFLDFMLS